MFDASDWKEALDMQITDGAQRACVRGEGGAPRRGGLHCPPSVALCDGASESRERPRERGPVGTPDLSVFGEGAIMCQSCQS